MENLLEVCMQSIAQVIAGLVERLHGSHVVCRAEFSQLSQSSVEVKVFRGTEEEKERGSKSWQ